MVRILIWWVSAECCHLYRKYGPRRADVWYFAYGSNVSDANLLKRRIRVLESRPFVLADYRLVFHHPSPYQGMGFADVVPEPGSEVPGRLLRIPASDALWLHLDELVFPFSRYRIERLSNDGLDFFFYRSNVPVPGLKPSEQYLKDIINGLAALGFSDDHLVELREVLTVNKLQRAAKSRYFVQNISRFPLRLRPFLEWYECLSLDLFRSIWNRSLFGSRLTSYIPKNSEPPDRNL